MKDFIEFKVKIPRQQVRNFLLKKGINADAATQMAYSTKEHHVQNRNQILRHNIGLMMDDRVF